MLCHKAQNPLQKIRFGYIGTVWARTTINRHLDTLPFDVQSKNKNQTKKIRAIGFCGLPHVLDHSVKQIKIQCNLNQCNKKKEKNIYRRCCTYFVYTYRWLLRDAFGKGGKSQQKWIAEKRKKLRCMMLFCRRMKWVRDPNFQIMVLRIFILYGATVYPFRLNLFLIYEKKKEKKQKNSKTHQRFYCMGSLAFFAFIWCYWSHRNMFLLFCLCLSLSSLLTRCVASAIDLNAFFVVSNLIVQYLSLRQSRSKDVEAIFTIPSMQSTNIVSQAHLIASKFTICLMHILDSI